MCFVGVPIGTAYFGRDVKAAVLVRPSTIDPSHTATGCDLISCTEQRHRWLLKCPTGQLLASFLAYGVMPQRYGTTTGPTVLASFLLIGLVGRDLYS